MPRRRTAQQDALITNLFDNEFERTSYKTNFTKKPILASDFLITATNPTLAQMAFIAQSHETMEVDAGTNATSALSTFSTGGGLTLTTAGASADQEIIRSKAVAAQGCLGTWDWSTSDELAFRCRLKTGASIADVRIVAGLFLTVAQPFAEGTDNDAIFFTFADASSANFRLCYNVGGTDAALDSGLAEAASTTYDLMITVSADRIVTFFIDDKIRGTSGSTALTADIDLLPFIGVEARATAAKACTIRGFGLSKKDND